MKSDKELVLTLCPKCGHVAGFAMSDTIGYCMYCCKKTPVDELEVL